MFVRLISCKFSPDQLKAVRHIYAEEIIPIVRRQKGNVNIRLLEPANKSEDFISLTEWRTKADAEAYEKSGLYKKLLDKLNSYFTKQPVLRNYHIEETVIRVTEHF